MAIKVQGTTVVDDSRNLTVNQLTLDSLTTVGPTTHTATTTASYTSATNNHSIDCSSGNYFSITTEAIPPLVVSWSFIEHTAAVSTVYNLPSGIQVGDKIYVYIFTTSISVPAVTGYTSGGLNFAGTSGLALYAATVVDPVPTTFTIGARTGSGNFLVVVVYRNIITNTARVAANSTTGMPDPPSDTISTSKVSGISMILGFLSTQNATVTGASSGYTLMGSLQGSTITGTVMAAYNSTPLVQGTLDPGAFIGNGNSNWYAAHQTFSPLTTFNPTLSFSNIPSSSQLYTCLLKIQNNSADGIVYPTNTLFAENNAFVPAKGTTGYQVIGTRNGGFNWLVTNLTGV